MTKKKSSKKKAFGTTIEPREPSTGLIFQAEKLPPFSFRKTLYVQHTPNIAPGHTTFLANMEDMSGQVARIATYALVEIADYKRSYINPIIRVSRVRGQLKFTKAKR